MTASAPTLTSERISVGEMPNGDPYVVPVLTAQGAQAGPTLLVHTGMHGDEVLGTEVVREVWRTIGGTALRGRLVMIPTSNLPGMATRTRTNLTEVYPGPQDMNRVFPGDARGSLTERVAHLLTTRFLATADYCIDIHTPSVGGVWTPYVSSPAPGSTDEETRLRTHAFAAAFGTTLIYSGDLFRGTLQDTARSLGTICSTSEFGEANRYDGELRDRGVVGIHNLLRHLDMTDGEPVVPADQWTFTRLVRIRAERGGFLRQHAQPGQVVAEGDRLASVGSLTEPELEVITAPVAGRVVRVNNNALVGTGDLVVYVGAEEEPR